MRECVDTLPDFDGIETKKRALVLAMDHPAPMVALHFFLAWPRQKLAERLTMLASMLQEDRQE